MKIRAKLILTFAFFIIPFLLLGILINIIFEREAKEHALIHVEIYAHTFALTIGRETEKDKTPPLFFNKEVLEDYVQDVYSTQKIDIVIVDTAKTIVADVIKSEIGKKYNYDKDNEVLQTMRDGAARTFKEVSNDYPRGIYLYAHPITTENGKTLGAVLIEYTTIIKKSEADINKVWQIVLYAILFFIFISIVFSLILSKKIRRSISNLVDAARKFSQGDYSVRIKTERKDELGELEKAFNLMVGQKQKSDEQILLLSNAIKSADEMISITDINNKFLFVNDAFCKGYGYTQEEVLGKYVDIIRSEINDVELLKHIQPTTLDYGWHGELWNKTKNGDDFLIELHTSPVKNAKGEIIALVGIANNITKRKEAEEKLKASEKRFREFADFLPQPVFEYDTKGVFTFANRASFEATGYTPDDIGKGLTVFNLIDPQQQQILIEMMKKRFNKITSGGIEYNIIRKDGSSFPAITYSSLIEINGEIKGVSGIFVDITERKKYEAIIKKNAAQLMLLNDIGSKITSALELDVIMDRAARLVHENFKYKHVMLLIYNEEENILTLKAVSGAFTSLFTPGEKFYLEKGMTIWAARTGNIAIANDVRIDPNYFNKYPDMIDTRSELTIPLKIGAKVVGIIDMQSPLLNAFNENDIRVLTTLADQIALAINNSLLYESIQQELHEKIKAEEALRQSEEKYKSLTEITSDWIWEIDTEGKYTYSNPNSKNLLGYEPDEIIGMSTFDFMPKEEAEHHRQLFNEVLASGKALKFVENINHHKNGSQVILETNAIPIIDSNGHCKGYRGIDREITDRKRAEEALKESEEKYRLVFTNVPLGITHYNSNGIITDCNDMFLEIMGIKKDDTIGFNVMHIRDQKLIEAFEVALTGFVGEYEGNYQSVISKKIISLKVSFAPIISKGGRVQNIVGIFEDISERKQIERFFFHDILNTAGNLRNYSALLGDSSLDDQENVMVNNSVVSLSNQIIDEIVSHRAILSSDKSEIKLNILQLNTLEFLNKMVVSFKQILEKENKHFVIDAKFEALEIKTDGTILGRIISNLIKNAIEASLPDGVVTVGCLAENDHVKFLVHNQSVIPDDIKTKIFHRSFSTKGGGRGIGTYSIKFLTEKYLKGKVSFTSNENVGTIFYVNIPAQI